MSKSAEGRITMKKLVTTAALTLMAAPAMAHPGHGFGLAPGLLHPLTGADHLLAMLAVGLWSGFVLPNRVWAGAATFMTGMTLGAALAWFGVAIAGIEAAILASVCAFGLLVALSRRGQPLAITAASLAMVAVFAGAHGYAHAVEATGAVAIYLVGFLISTAALHLAGIGIAAGVARLPRVQGLIGAGIAGAGVYMMVGG
jgi:urease accessory protein